jgi:hypothetical protein
MYIHRNGGNEMPSIASMNKAAARAAAERARRAALTPAQREAEDRAEREAYEANRQAAADRFETQRAANRVALLEAGVTPRAFAAAKTCVSKRDREFLDSIIEQFGNRDLSSKQIAIVAKIVAANEVSSDSIVTARLAYEWLGAA